MSNALVSVIVPAYNCGQYLPDALDSALAQTHHPTEVIVVNDGSSDDTCHVVQPYLDRITYIEQANKGLSAARNVGFRASTGSFVCFLDADDMLLPDKFERQLEAFRREPNLGVVISGYTDVEEDGRTPILTVEKPWHRDGLQRLLNHEVFPCHTALVRRTVLEASDLFPEDIDTRESQEDWQLWLGLALNGVVFESIAGATCLYRQRQGSIRADPLKHMDGATRVVRWLRRHPGAALFGREIDRLEAIVGMERVAAAFRVGQHDSVGPALGITVEAHLEYWMEPSATLRLFERTLTSGESSRWSTNLSPKWFETRVINEILPLGRGHVSARAGSIVVSSAHLQLADLAYAAHEHALRRRAMLMALANSPATCLRRAGVRSLVRGIVGPTVGRTIGSLVDRKTDAPA